MSDDEDHLPGRSQARAADLTGAEISKMAKDLVRMAIYSENKREAMTKDNIMKTIFKHEHTRCFPLVFTEAQRILKETFAMEMVETFTRATTKSGVDGTKKNNRFILRSTLSAADRVGYVEWGEQEEHDMAFLTILLALIYAHGKQIAHGPLVSCLKKIDMTLDIEKHPYSDSITKFVHAGYLDRFKLDARDEHQVYIWGTRSKILFPEESMIDFIAAMHTNVSLENREGLIQGIQRAGEGI